MNQTKVGFVIRVATVLILLIFFNSTVSAQGTEGLPPLKIVQLGDSYSAGNGARSESGNRNYTSVPGCYRSPTNWGSQFTASLKDTFAVTYINRACSGGVVADITIERDMQDDRLKNLNGSCPSPDYPDEELYRDTSLLKCSRFIEPQIDAIDSTVNLVVMTMGGNDLGFATIVEKCFSIMKSPSGCREALDYANSHMESLGKDLKDTFAAIKGKLGSGAKIVYVSYPNLLLADVQYRLVRWQGTLFEDTYDAGKEIRALSKSGEDRQRTAVEEANAAAGEDYIIFYEGTKMLFAGHEPDPSDAVNPDRWITEFEGNWLLDPKDRIEVYHPNALGHENWAAALSSFGTFGAGGGTFDTNADIDVALVVDTTGSMYDEIAQVQADLSSLVDQLAATTDSYRVALVSYRDFPERTGNYADYPSRVIQTFTDDPVSIQAAIDSLTLGYGGDNPETVFSGIQAAIELPWRAGVTKMAIVIGDAAALSPEPISNLTADQIVANSIAVDPVEVIGVNTGSLNSNGALGQIADRTGGSVVQGTSELTTKISEILDSAARQPFAWLSSAYSGKIGQPILFDASGSYDPTGSKITLYEWDFDGDGVFDLQTEAATATHTYDVLFNDFVILRVTSAGGTALASARTVVNAEGFVSQGDEVACELDENGYSITVDQEGRFIPCTADSLPESGLDGVSVISGYSTDTTGVFRPSNGLLYLKNSNDTGIADMALNYGLPGDYPVVGDWDGNGTVTIGIYRNGFFYLRNENTIGFAEVIFPFGQPGDQPIAGDWDGDGVDTIGIFRPSIAQFLLRNSNSEGTADASFYLGNPGDVGIAGDWNGDGLDTTGVFRPSNGIIFLKDKNDTGIADYALNYGLPGDKPVMGDWDMDGIDTIGIYRNGTFYLRNENTNGFATIVFGLGNPGDMPISGNWDGSIP